MLYDWRVATPGAKLIAVVMFYLQRHGQKRPHPRNDGLLTPRGKRQSAAAAVRYLNNLRFHAAFSSDKRRAKETARIALGTVGVVLPVQELFGLCYEWLEDAGAYPKWPTDDAQLSAAQTALQAGLAYPAAVVEGLNLRMSMIEVARAAVHCGTLDSLEDVPLYNVYGASHGPLV